MGKTFFNARRGESVREAQAARAGASLRANETLILKILGIFFYLKFLFVERLNIQL